MTYTKLLPENSNGKFLISFPKIPTDKIVLFIIVIIIIIININIKYAAY